MKEEDYLREKLGQRNPFTVPDGYFDHLADSIVQQLPAKRKHAVIRSLRPWLYAAACAVILFVSVLFVSNQSSEQTQQQTAANHTNASESVATNSTDNYLEDMADYAMIDNEDIYLYLADI